MKRKILPFLAIAIIVGGILALMLNAGMFTVWQHRMTDALYGGGQPLKNIKIIAIDDKSLQELGRWPFNRQYYVTLLEKTNQSKLIGFDIAFFEPSSKKDDDALGDALRAAGNAVIASEAAEFEKENGELVIKKTLEPIPALANISTGIVNVFTDADGIARSIPARMNSKNSFAVMLAEKFVGKTSVPDRMLVNYVGRPYSYETHPFTDVITGRIAPEAFSDSIVLVGATAPDLRDDYVVPTSWGRRMPGVEIHAHALQTILTKQFLHYQTRTSTIAMIIVLALLTALLYWKLSEIKASIGAAALIIIIIVSAITLYNKGTILNILYGSFSIILASASSITYIARSETKHKKQIIDVFGKYVSKDVVKHLLDSKKALELGGQEKEISVLFVDIRGFTSISEKMKPHEVIKFLNHYFGHMTDVVFKNNGTLDKFIGDCIMAVFNSPHDEPEHAYKAVKTAIEMMEACDKLQKEGLPKIKIGIGINTGKAVIGNMGSSQRQEFTALGDAVNTASRLCSTAQGGQTIIGKQTYEQCKNKITTKKLEPIKVKGKEKPLEIYEVIGLK